MHALLTLALVSLQAGTTAGDRTLPPDPAATPIVTAQGKGVQIYRCQDKPDGSAWVFVAPEATLYQGAEKVGTHGAGPTWRWKDGSMVSGKLLVSQPAPDGKSIPWLLLTATPGPTPGTLAQVSYVRRSDTQGGAAPQQGCDAQHLGSLIRIDYSATYTFYGNDRHR
jgi:hypothetical protein